jgi:cytochrome c oxidase subunit 2
VILQRPGRRGGVDGQATLKRSAAGPATSGRRPGDERKVTKMKTMNALRRHLAHASLAAFAAMAAPATWAVNDLPGGPAVRQLDLPVGASKMSETLHQLHWIMMIICTVIFLAVFGVMFYSIIKHRKSKGHKPANFHESVAVEIA